MSEPQKPRRKWLRRLLYGGLGLLALVIVTVIVAVLYLRSSYGREFARKQIESVLDEALVGGGSVGALEGSVFGDLVIRDIVINDATGEPAIIIKRAKLEYSRLIALDAARRSVTIDLVALSGVTVHARNLPDGRLNLAALTVEKPDEKDDEGGGFHLLVRDMRLEDGFATVALDGKPIEHIDDISLSGASFESSGGGIAMVIGASAARARERDIEATLAGSVAMAEKRIDIRDVNVRVAGAELALDRATIEDGEPGVVSARLEAPATAIKKLLPTSKLLADASLRFESDGGPITVTGELGTTELRGTVAFGVRAKTVKGQLEASNVVLASLWSGLPDTRLKLTVSANYSEGSASGTIAVSGDIEDKSIEAASATAVLAGKRLTASLKATNPSTSVTATGEVLLEKELRIVASRVELASTDLRAALSPWVEVAGDIDADVKLSGRLAELAIEGEIKSKSFSGFGVLARGVTIKPKLERVGDSAKGVLVVGTRSLAVSGLAFERPFLSITSKNGEDGTLVARAAGKDADVRLETGFVWTTEMLTATIAKASGRYKRFEVGSDKGTFTWAPKQATIKLADFELVTSAGEATASATMSLDGRLSGDVSIEAQAINLAELSRLAELDTPLAGTASLSAKVNTVRTPSATIILRAYSVKLPSDVPVTSGELTAELTGRDLAITARGNMPGAAEIVAKAQLRGPRDPRQLGAWARLDRRSVTAVNASARINNVAVFTHLHPELPRRGRLELTAVQAPGATAVELTLTGNRVVTARFDEPTDVRAVVSLDGKRLGGRGNVSVSKRASADWIAAAELRGPWFVPRSYRNIDLETFKESKVNIKDIDVDWWAARYAPEVKPSGARATLALNHRTDIKAVDVDATITLPRGGPQSRQISQETVVSATIGERRTEAKVIAHFAGKQRLDGDGELAFGWRDVASGRRDYQRAAARARVSVKKLPLVALREIARTTPIASDAAISGTLSATASFSGTVEEPRLAANASIDGAVIADVAFASLLAGGSLKGGKVDITATGDQHGGGRLVVRGETDLNKGEDAPISAAVVANKFDLGFLRELFPDRRIGGLLTADVSASGTRRTPVFAGEAVLEQGSVNPGGPLYSLRNAKLRAELTGDRVKISGNARSGRGQALIAATLELKANRPQALDLKLTTKKFPLDAGLLIRVDSETNVTGEVRGGKWRLVANVEEAIINLPDELSRTLHPTSLPGDIVFADEVDAAKNALPPVPTEIEIQVRADDSILVRGGIANAVIGAALKVNITDQIRVAGAIRAEQGWVELINRRYDVRTGEVLFSGKLDPGLNIELAHEFRALTLFISVGGLASNPIVEFRSDPAQYDDSELLSFVLGADPDEPSTDDRSLAGRATGVATSLVVGQLSSAVTKVTPIDVLRIDAEKSAVGLWLTEKLLLGYRHRFAADPQENTGELTFEYRFLKRWLLDGYVGQLKSGGDVLWIRRF